MTVEDFVEVKAGDRPIRARAEGGHPVVVTDTRSRHNLAIGFGEGAGVRMSGSVGYYCGGLNCGADIVIERDAGLAVGEAMSSGRITVGGYAGMSAGTSMLGGLLHVRGSTGPRCGLAMKGGTVIVEGQIGYLSGFKAHAGRIIALDGVDDACADSLRGGEVWLAKPPRSLGVDSRQVEPTSGEVDTVEGTLAPLGLADSSRDWIKIVSARR